MSLNYFQFPLINTKSYLYEALLLFAHIVLQFYFFAH